MMTDKEIKKLFENLLVSDGREGMDMLLSVMAERGFYDSPASTSGSRHSADPGGLAKHSLLVYGYARRLKRNFGIPDEQIPEGSLMTVCLLHDLGKMGDFGKPLYTKNVLKSGKVSDAKPWERNKELTNIPHAIRSVIIAERYIDLTEEEEYAVMYHDGLYDRETGGNSVIPGHETDLLLLLHWADMWSSRFVEGDQERENLILEELERLYKCRMVISGKED